MREIKYRIWDKDLSAMFIPGGKAQPRLYLDLLGNVYTLDSNHSPVQVHNVLLVQYTGLKDKNGKEIYEGDIIKTLDYIEDASYEICKVYWDAENVQWAAVSNESDDNLSAFTNDCEIIGNIYESPKSLLEGK